MADRKRMKKLRKKRITSVQRQIGKHQSKLENEPGRLDTTKDYWKKEINEKFLRQIEEDESYLEGKDGNPNKKGS